MSAPSSTAWFQDLPTDVQDQVVRMVRAISGMSSEEKMNAAAFQMVIIGGDGPGDLTRELALALQDLLLRLDEHASPENWPS